MELKECFFKKYSNYTVSNSRSNHMKMRERLKYFICMNSVSYVQETLHWPSETGKEDFIQGYCNRGERLNLTLLKEKVGELSSSGVI